ncbi:MAG: hypothetical protein GY769_25335 [bacterium]|nr:hypothetical protein [bacterium]
MRFTALLLLHLIAALSCGATPVAESSSKISSGQELLRSRVDSDEATEYLAWLLRRPPSRDRDPAPALPTELARLDRRAVSSILAREELQEVTRRHSVDLATLLLARSVLANPENAELDAIYARELAKLRKRQTVARANRTSKPTVLFVPGFLYLSHPETGGDFAVPRSQLTEMGVSNRLIETDEAGSVESNARQIAATLRELRDERILIVSASKGGPEVALALGRLLEREEARPVVAWINIGGLLGGSPLADRALRPSRWWLVKVALWWNNLKPDGVRSLRTLESRQRLADLSLPPDLPIINVVPVPLSGDVSRQAKGGYRKLRRLEPNDGLALLTDQILPGSRTLLLLGDDHFLTRQDSRALTLALLSTARHVIEARATDRQFLNPAPNPHRSSRFVDESPKHTSPPASTGRQPYWIKK